MNGWRRMAAGVGAIVVAAAVGALAGRTPADPVCARPTHSVRPLDLSRDADRAQLHEDISNAKAAAETFARAVAARPLLSDSFDAKEGARTAPMRARVWCEATLAAQIAADDHLPAPMVAAAFQGSPTTDHSPGRLAPQTDPGASAASRGDGRSDSPEVK